MPEYQTKFHKYICETFRWTTFAFVVLSLLLVLINVWGEGIIPEELFGKVMFTTFAMIIASGVVMVIFSEKTPKN